jgi:hypothetical protein
MPIDTQILWRPVRYVQSPSRVGIDPASINGITERSSFRWLWDGPSASVGRKVAVFRIVHVINTRSDFVLSRGHDEIVKPVASAVWGFFQLQVHLVGQKMLSIHGNGKPWRKDQYGNRQ